ncbi:hypothetical protein JAB9_47340 [Janthinobacterium sp. HH107]|nr:hypothetical protein JAB9_47340 [Janthinobacterium sp. HH107]
MNLLLSSRDGRKYDRRELLSLQLIYTFDKYSLCLLAMRNCQIKKGINADRRRKVRLSKHFFKAFINCSERSNYLVQATDQFVRAQFMSGNRAYCTLGIQYNVFGCSNSHTDKGGIASGQANSDELSGISDFTFGAIQNRGGSLRSSKQRSFIGIGNKLRRVPILSAHHEYRDPQSGDRANSLNPSRPAVLCKAHFVANDRNSHRSSDQCDSKKYIGFLHETTQSCLKGILA